MISRKHATRILALLLAVLLFGQLAAFQLPVSAASAVPAGHDGAAYIPAGADVNDLLSQTLLSNYDEVGCQQWEYRATSVLSDYAVKWTPVNGFDTTGSFFRDRLNASYPALNSESAAQSYTVRIEGTSTVYTFTKLASPAADAAAPSVTPDAAPGTDPAVTPDTDTDTAPDAALSTAAGTTEDDNGTCTLNMTYTADGEIDFDALRAAIVAAVLPVDGVPCVRNRDFARLTVQIRELPAVLEFNDVSHVGTSLGESKKTQKAPPMRVERRITQPSLCECTQRFRR